MTPAWASMWATSMGWLIYGISAQFFLRWFWCFTEANTSDFVNSYILNKLSFIQNIIKFISTVNLLLKLSYFMRNSLATNFELFVIILGRLGLYDYLFWFYLSLFNDLFLGKFNFYLFWMGLFEVLFFIFLLLLWLYFDYFLHYNMFFFCFGLFFLDLNVIMLNFFFENSFLSWLL